MAKMYFYYAAMNAGKSTNLLQASHNYTERGMKTEIFTSSLDNRYGYGYVTSRLGIKEKATLYNNDFNFFEFMKDKTDTSCIFVDESQFLTREQVDQLASIVDTFNIPVLAYGLRTDFQGNLFEGSMRLLAISDSIKELKTMCFCGVKAVMNARIDKDGKVIRDGEQIEIGGNEAYVPLCRKHFIDGIVNDRKNM